MGTAAVSHLKLLIPQRSKTSNDSSSSSKQVRPNNSIGSKQQQQKVQRSNHTQHQSAPSSTSIDRGRTGEDEESAEIPKTLANKLCASGLQAAGDMATFHRAPDQWTSVHDQFGNFRYWLHRETQERRYMNNPPRQPLAFPPMAFEGALHINPAIDPRLHFVARPPAEGFPPPLGWIDEFHSPALEVREPTVGRGWAPPVMGNIGRFPFPPNNFTRPLPRPSLRRRSSPKPSTKEADQWFLQSNKKGEKYYLNTTTWEWQIETPDCLKKYTTR